MNAEHTGRIVHRDLMSTDPEASKRFFCALFGWSASEVAPAGPESKHTQLRHRDQMVCALMHFDANHGFPSHFIPYVASDDVDAFCERAKQAGGTVCFGPMDLGDAGRWALINDPGGGLFTAFRGSGPYAPQHDGATPAGLFCWEELLATDPAREMAFYSEVCGWGSESVDIEGATYHTFTRGDQQLAGCMRKPADAPGPTAWLSYVSVEDVDATRARAAELGAQVWVEPTDLPDIGRFAVLADPTGASFAIYRHAGG
ncbi:MAG: VOC family protein [Planctomycetota bacterium]